MVKDKIVIVDQSFFGEKDRGHGLLKTTIINKELNAYLSRISDLPVNKPADLQIEPFYGCHKLEPFIIFTKTIINKKGSRPGLVFTQALIIETQDCVLINDLGKIFDLFIDSIPETNDFEIFQIEIDAFAKCPYAKDVEINQLLSLANFLLTTNHNQVCVLPLGNDMPKLFISFWNIMIPELRQLIAFRLSFTFNDTHPDQYQIYFTPPSVLSRWPAETNVSSYFVDPINASKSVKLLIGDQQAASLKTFIGDLNFTPINFHSISLCEKAFNYYSELNIINESKLLQLIRLVIKLSPNKIDGKKIKENILKKLESLIKSAQSDSILILSFSNIDFSPFIDSALTISKLIEGKFFDFWNGHNENEIIPILQRRLEEETTTWWEKSIDSSLKNALKKIDSKAASMVWRIWQRLDSTIPYLEQFLPSASNIQKLLINGIPAQISNELARKLTSVACNNNWYQLHAHLLIGYMPAKDALDQQLKVNPTDKDSLSIVAGIFQPIEFIKTSIESNSDVLMELALDMPIPNNIIVKSANANSRKWQLFVAQKLKQQLPKKVNLNDFTSFVWKIWDCLIKRDDVVEDLLIILSISPFNNLIHYKQRASLWEVLPKGIKNKFLTSTGKAILKDLPAVGEIEPPLQDAFLNLDIVSDYMNANSKDWNKILNVFDYIQNLPQQYLIDHLNYTGQDIDSVNAGRLGMLVKFKSWDNCANVIYDKAKINDGYKAALSSCGHLLGFWRRLKINYTYSNTPKAKAISESEWLSNFEELCNEIYHEDNEIRIIWKRAGGDVSDLKSKESARVIWHSALNNIQKGKMRGMTFRTLVSQMATENPAKRNKFNMLLNSLVDLPNLNK